MTREFSSTRPRFAIRRDSRGSMEVLPINFRVLREILDIKFLCPSDT
jgi:hypothetical protein